MTTDTISSGPICPVLTIKVLLSRSSSSNRWPEMKNMQQSHTDLKKKNVFGISGFNLICFKTQNNNVYSEFRLKKACSETQKPKLKFLCINVKTPSKSRHRANTALYNNECCLHTSDCTSTKHYKERTQDLWEHQIHFCSVCLWTVNCDKRKKILHFFLFFYLGSVFQENSNKDDMSRHASLSFLA